ncbi:pyridoxamine 5'-phosphate oxidase family protein [Kocuria rhizosphaericola]|uniref:pyridoxamine 5'-phosphate oxidase family protein n=1 Tax=Kocuria rhizosphaericola TaxID=3376284 RepID=UPI00379C893E
MTDTHGNDVEELAVNSCWELLRDAGVGRLAVWVEDHPDIFPINFVVDHGTLVFRSAEGTKIAGALTDVPVAVEIDGYDESSAKAWSVVVKGRAERIQQVQELMDTVDLPLFPWQTGQKGVFVRVVPGSVTGRRFPVADPGVWRTPLSGARRAPDE